VTCEFLPLLKDPHTCKACGGKFTDHRQSQKNAGRNRHLTPAQEAHVIEWWSTCRTVQQKADELGVSKVVIYKAIARHDPSRRAK